MANMEHGQHGQNVLRHVDLEHKNETELAITLLPNTVARNVLANHLKPDFVTLNAVQLTVDGALSVITDHAIINVVVEFKRK